MAIQNIQLTLLIGPTSNVSWMFWIAIRVL